jgi:hypothetical protein
MRFSLLHWILVLLVSFCVFLLVQPDRRPECVAESLNWLRRQSDCHVAFDAAKRLFERTRLPVFQVNLHRIERMDAAIFYAR